MPDARGSQKRVSGLLWLELWMVVRYHVSAGIQTPVLWKGNQVLLNADPSLYPRKNFFMF